MLSVYGENLFFFDNNNLLEDLSGLDYPDSVQFFEHDYGINHVNNGKNEMLVRFMKKETRGKFVDPRCVYSDPFRSYTPFVNSLNLEGPTLVKSEELGDGMSSANVMDVRLSPNSVYREMNSFSGLEPLWNERDSSLGRNSKNLDGLCDSNQNLGTNFKYHNDDDCSWMSTTDEGYNIDMDVDVRRSRKRKISECSELEIPDGFKLPASKSPIMEAMSYCAINKWGIEIHECKDEPTDGSPASVVFKITDFELYYKYSSGICSKQNPTEDIGSRVKSLRRWFTNFPKKRERKDNPQFLLEVKPDVAKKVYAMIEKYKCLVNVKKRRRLK